MFFASDNGGPVHPRVWEALRAADAGTAMPYGNDALSAQVVAQVRELFEAPQATVHLVGTGTAANALILAVLARPWDGIFCAPMAHIAEDECNAVEFYSGGAKLVPVAAPGGKICPAALEAAMAAAGGSVHQAQRGPLSLTNLTELGTAYSVAEITALCAVARGHGAAVHLDGARLANAVAALGCTPAQMTWQAGVDAVSFGGTKNGLMGVEAVVFFDPRHGHELELRRKRGGHLASKGRYLAAQMQAYLHDDLWLEMARQANAHGARLAQGLARAPGARLLHPVAGNLMFAEMARAQHRRLRDAGAQYYLHGAPEGPPQERLSARFVCDWDAGARVSALLGLLGG